MSIFWFIDSLAATCRCHRSVCGVHRQAVQCYCWRLCFTDFHSVFYSFSVCFLVMFQSNLICIVKVHPMNMNSSYSACASELCLVTMSVDETDAVNNLLLKGFNQRTNAEKLQIVKGGRPKPKLPNLKAEHKEKSRTYTRSFTYNNYEKYQWLTGSQTKNKLYCWPCLLFSTESGPWNRTGFDNLNYFSTACIKHQGSLSHIRAFACLLKFKKEGGERFDHLQELQMKIADQKHNEKVTENRAVLKRLIDAVIFLGKQECSFRGHDESDGSNNKGMYIELLYFLSDYDPVLANHLKTATVFEATSPQVQNDLINSVATVLDDRIKKEISESEFVAILLDETTKISNKSQLSTVIRFVDKNGFCRERFLHFKDVSKDRTAEGLFKVVKEVVNDLNCAGKIVADTFDGATVEPGHHGGLQALLKNEYSMATFVHCYAHRLDLVLSKSTMSIKECQRFFISLQGLPAFFSHSTDALKNFMSKKLLGIAPTRCDFTYRFITTVKDYRSQLTDFFLAIEEDPTEWTSEEVNKATGFVRFLTKLETKFLLNVFSEVFLISDDLFDILHTKNMDFSFCTKKVKEFYEYLQKKRDSNFERVWLETTQNQESEEAHLRRESQDDVKSKNHRIFLEIIDTMMLQIKSRFESQSQMKFINLMNSSLFKDFHTKLPEDLILNLKERYGNHFDLFKLKNELTVFYAEKYYWDKPINYLTVSMKKEKLDIVFGEVYKLAQLVLTIPSTAASPDRSFSALKRIEDYLKSTQSNNRLGSLAIISIEKDLLLNMKSTEDDFYTKVIEAFIETGSRLDFMYR